MRYMIYALLLSAGVTILLGPVLIPLLKRLKFGQCERELGPKSHLTKQGTPTMGGLMFIFGILAGTLAFSLSARRRNWCCPPSCARWGLPWWAFWMIF